VLVFGLLLCAHTAEGWRRRRRSGDSARMPIAAEK
uniref:Uncharacterized protein n=1 Tax=Ciona intestinalis TaxID=7719 RepID=F6TYT2_CIOIN